MSATVPLSYLLGIDSSTLSKEEIVLLEAELFVRLYENLKEIFRKQYQNYFCIMKFTVEMENNMLETNFIRLIIEDILITEEYTLEGIANYTDTPEDVIHDVVSGLNTKPSVTFFRRIIELHRSVRQELYHTVIKKIALEYSAVA